MDPLPGLPDPQDDEAQDPEPCNADPSIVTFSSHGLVKDIMNTK